MRIIQLYSSLSYGDAIGNDILALDSIIKSKGYEARIFAEYIDSRISKDIASAFSNYRPQKDDVIILHVGGASKLNEWIKKAPCSKKIMVYHNITPPVFFEPYSKKCADYCRSGLSQIASLKDTFDMVLAVSEFNKQNLLDMGYKCKINVLPILIPFSDYEKEPSAEILEKYNDDYTNIIFLGRIVPNKKQQDVIAAFNSYQKNYNPKSRLFLIGNPRDFENYGEQLKEYTKRLETSNVIFTGHTKFNEILAYYKLSDLFLCMSEHEGFCVPLVEAMYFNIPILAYASSAIPSTLGGSGFVLKDKNPEVTAAVMNKILSEDNLKKTILENQAERLADFAHEKVAELFWNCIQTKDFWKDK